MRARSKPKRKCKPLKTPSLVSLLLLILNLAGCSSMESVDRSLVNHAAMDLRQANDCGQPSPSSGLRSMRKAGGAESCATCVQ